MSWEINSATDYGVIRASRLRGLSTPNAPLEFASLALYYFAMLPQFLSRKIYIYLTIKYSDNLYLFLPSLSQRSGACRGRSGTGPAPGNDIYVD